MPWLPRCPFCCQIHLWGIPVLAEGPCFGAAVDCASWHGQNLWLVCLYADLFKFIHFDLSLICSPPLSHFGSYRERAVEGLWLCFFLGRGALELWDTDIHFVEENWSENCMLPPRFLNKGCMCSSEYGLQSSKYCWQSCLQCEAATSSVFLCLTPETVTWVEFHLPITDLNYAVR